LCVHLGQGITHWWHLVWLKLSIHEEAHLSLLLDSDQSSKVKQCFHLSVPPCTIDFLYY
jgi:hypothetical protein